jgi:hypothetical protein
MEILSHVRCFICGENVMANEDIKLLMQFKTPGKWQVTHWGGGLYFDGPPVVIRSDVNTAYGEPPVICRDAQENDARFIASAPEFISRLLEQVNILQQALIEVGDIAHSCFYSYEDTQFIRTHMQKIGKLSQDALAEVSSTKGR